MKEDRDERTIKEIIEYLKKQNGNCSNELSNVEGLCLVNYIEWLEKEKDRLGKLFYERNEENIRLNNIINELNWKPIKEYDESNYDWVLVKYFDGNYECVPIVAEKRFGKWYSSEGKEIKFKIKYFFDMQQLDKLQELKGSDKE